jgi:hypothetical protein
VIRVPLSDLGTKKSAIWFIQRVIPGGYPFCWFHFFSIGSSIMLLRLISLAAVLLLVPGSVEADDRPNITAESHQHATGQVAAELPGTGSQLARLGLMNVFNKGPTRFSVGLRRTIEPQQSDNCEAVVAYSLG